MRLAFSLVVLFALAGCMSQAEMRQQESDRLDRQVQALRDLTALLDTTLSHAEAPFALSERRDDFDRYTRLSLDSNYTPVRGLRPILKLNPIAVLHDSGDIQYALQAEYLYSDWMFIDDGESLVFLIDGERVGLTGPGSAADRDVLDGRLLRERATYEVDPTTLRTLAAADSVRLRLTGSEGLIEREVSQSNLQNIARFMEEVDQRHTSD